MWSAGPRTAVLAPGARTVPGRLGPPARRDPESRPRRPSASGSPMTGPRRGTLAGVGGPSRRYSASPTRNCQPTVASALTGDPPGHENTAERAPPARRPAPRLRRNSPSISTRHRMQKNAGDRSRAQDIGPLDRLKDRPGGTIAAGSTRADAKTKTPSARTASAPITDSLPTVASSPMDTRGPTRASSSTKTPRPSEADSPTEAKSARRQPAPISAASATDTPTPKLRTGANRGRDRTGPRDGSGREPDPAPIAENGKHPDDGARRKDRVSSDDARRVQDAAGADDHT